MPSLTSLLILCASAPLFAVAKFQIPFFHHASRNSSAVTSQLFAELEELARIVDISYCVGTSGIQKPFECLSRCSDFPNFQLVSTWNTGIMLSDSCGYITLDHTSDAPRIILAFRGTYSLANTIVDLSTVPQEYVPYPGDKPESPSSDANPGDPAKCTDCKVHSGFLTSWQHTRDAILDDLIKTIEDYPSYTLHFVGHSLGGAVALLAALDLKARGHTPHVTTFGEPRVGNAAFVAHVDARLVDIDDNSSLYRRVTHVDDPVPLLPITEWGYQPHAGEVYIARSSLPPEVGDLRRCKGDKDDKCSAGADSTLIEDEVAQQIPESTHVHRARDLVKDAQNAWDAIPTRLKLWQLFFAHRDYFWRLGLCVKGGDPWDWKGQYPTADDL